MEYSDLMKVTVSLIIFGIEFKSFTNIPVVYPVNHTAPKLP